MVNSIDIVFRLTCWQVDSKPFVGFVYPTKLKVVTLPKEYIPAVEKDLEAMKQNGPLAGYAFRQFKSYFIRWFVPPVDSDALSFRISS